MKKLKSVNEVFKELENKKNNIYKHKFQKYIVSYEINDDKIKVISNIGNYRNVSNTKENLNKINQAIVKNKLDIINRIDKYEATGTERIAILFVNLLLVGLTGVLIPFSFFTGSYLILLFSLITFSISVITASILGVDYYIQASEIQNLKEVTGYKKDNELNLSNINFNIIKNK